VWTMQVLTPGAHAFLAELPVRAEFEGALLVHGSPREPVDEYMVDARTARASFVADGFRVAFIGHTHQPAVFVERNHRVNARGLLPEVPLPLQRTYRYIINIGSVGQPRDADPRAAYAVLDTTGPSVTLHRVAYPVEHTQRKMEAAGLPVPLIERLALGR